MEVERIEDVPGFVTSGERENLVDGQINRVKRESDSGVAHGGNKSPGRVARPLDLCRMFIFAHDRANETGLTHINVDGVSVGVEQTPVGGEGLGDPSLGIVEIVEIAAESVGVRLDQDRGPARKVGIEGPVLGEQSGEARLEVG